LAKPATNSGRALPPQTGDRSAWLAAPAMVAALLWPALWNGFPLIFPDTGGYLLRPLEGTLALGRSALYGAFLAAGLPFDFWPNIVIQAVVTVFIIRITLRAQGLGTGAGPALITVSALALLTPLPWYVSQLMPDIAVGWAVLSLYLLAVRGDALRRFEAPTLGAVIAFAIASHMATLALCLGLVAWFALMRFAAPRIGMPRAQLGAPALAVAAGLLLAPASNYLIARAFAFTPGGTSFVFGRLIQDGLIKRYLAEHCPDDTVKLCAHAHELPGTADEWLWTYASPIHKLGGWEAYAPEARRLVLATARLYPAEHLRTAARAAIEQFAAFRTVLAVSRGDNFDVIETFERVLPPAANARFLAARQQRDQPDLSAANAVHMPVAVASVVLLGFVALRAGRGRTGRATHALAATVALALIGNAVICGVFSNPNDRYQNRLIWIAVLAAAVVIGNRLRRAAAHDPPEQAEQA
jgi:hypothetical protein